MLSLVVWQSLHLLPLAIGLAVVLAFAVFWLYPAQVGNVRRPWNWVLPSLRLAGLLVLVTSLLQPVAERELRTDERGAVLVLVDRSKSMSVTDASRTPAQLVALAAGLGRLPEGARGREGAELAWGLDRLRDQVADVLVAANDVETAEAFGRGIEAAGGRLATARGAFGETTRVLAARAEILPAGDLRARLAALNDLAGGAPRDAWATDARARIAAARDAVAAQQLELDRKLYESDAGVRAACDEVSKMSRRALARDALFRPETSVIARVAANMPVVAYGFAGALTAGARLDGGGEVPPDESGTSYTAAPDGVASNVAGAVPAALADAAGRPVRAVVLLSDGRQVGAEASIVSGLQPAGAPVFTVGVAPAERPPDRSFAREVATRATAFVGETVTVRAAVNASGLPAGGVDVQLKTGEAVHTQRVELKSDAAEPARVEFSLRMEAGGPQRITISVPAAPGEITAENNTIERWVKVLPQRMNVAAFAGTPGWDFQLLRNTLARTPWVSLTGGVLGGEEPKLPLTSAQILEQDVLVLSDVPAGALDGVQWDAVNRLVRERGGSLFLLAGPDHLPTTYTPSAIVAASLLPYDANSFAPSWRAWPGERPAFRFVPAPGLGAEQAAALRFGPGAGTLRQWDALGGAFRFIPVPELSPAANAHALLVEADSRLPVLTESFPGNGRVLFLGTNETWRWRTQAGGRDFERFWLQLLRYAAGDPYAVQRDLLALDVDRVAPAPGEALNVRARILQGDADAMRVQVVRNDDGEVVREHALTSAGSPAGGRYAVTVQGLPAGGYTIRLADPANAAVAPLELPLHVAASAEAEMADLAGDDGLLRRIADASGGQFLPLERVGELPALLAATGDRRSKYAEWRLWDSPLLFLFVVACFGAEWALRKRLGLA